MSMGLLLCRYLDRLPEVVKMQIVILTCLWIQKHQILFKLMDAKEFLEKESGSSVDIVRNHQNLNPKLKRRILKDGILIF